MGQTKPPPTSAGGHQPRHALEAADAGGQRTIAAVRRVAGRIATGLNAAEGDADATSAMGALHFAITGQASGRYDQFDGLLSDDADIAAIALEPVHAPALLIVDHALSALLVERQYGGRIEALGSVKARRTGMAEARAFARLVDTVAAALQQSCDDRVPLSVICRAPEKLLRGSILR
jgi:hypothetical protein